MRILHVNPFFFPYSGGIERRVLGLCKQLKARGHDVHVLTGQLEGTPREEVFEGIPVTRLPSKFKNVYNPPWITSKGVEEAIWRLKPDVIDFHYRWAPSYTKPMRRIVRETPVVFTYHNTFGEGPRGWRWLTRLNDQRFLGFLRDCRKVVCVSEFVRDQLVDHGMPADHTRVVYNGVDPTSDEELKRLRGAGPDERSPYCIFVGRLVHIKGVDVLIDAAARSQAQVRFKIVGKGPAMEKLKARAVAKGVAARFEFLGFVDEGEKRRLIARAEAMTHPARFEASAVILYEALDLGCPVITTKTGGSPEIVGDAGELVALNAPAELAGAIDRMMSDKAWREALAVRARERSALFTWATIAAEMEGIYERAAGPR